MKKSKLLSQSGGGAILIGGVLALYTSLTTFFQIPYGWWLAFHNLLVVISLGLAAFVGYKHRSFEVSFKFMLLAVAIFFSIIMLLYIGSYVMTTAFFADKMIWIPFFYHDYNYHGFESVASYLNHENNFRELLELQVFSFSIGSVMYFTAGSLGYGAKAIIGGMRNLRARLN